MQMWLKAVLDLCPMEQSYGSPCSALKQPTGQAEGDLKLGVITNHNIGFCKAHSTLNFKANGPEGHTLWRLS